MSNFGQMQADMQLLGMASLLNQDFGNLINKVNREEVESYPWSFLFQSVTIYGSAPITTGGITVLTGNQQVDGGAAIWTPTLIGAGTLPDNSFYLWTGPSNTTPLPVAGVTNTLGTNLLLQTPFGEPSLTNAPYVLQQIFYNVAPLQTIERVRQIDDLVETSRAELDRIDPSRIATGGAPSIRWAAAPFGTAITLGGSVPLTVGTTTVNPLQLMIELWPRSSQALPYIIDGKIGPVDMVALTDQPQLPSQVIEAKAMMYAARAVFASSGNPKWLQISEAYRQDYVTELEKAKTEDTKRVVPKGITSWGGRRLFDAAIDPTHDLDGPRDYQTGRS